MHILIFTKDLVDGDTQRIVATLANYWAGRRREVTVVTLAPEDGDSYVFDPGVQRISLNLDDDGVDMTRALRRSVRAVAALRRILAALRPEVVLAMTSTASVLLAFASYRLGLCTVGSETGYHSVSLLDRACTMLRRPMYRYLDAVVAQTGKDAEWLGTHLQAARVAVIPNVALSPFPQYAPRIAPSALVGAGRRVLLAIGPLDRERQFGLLLQAFSELTSIHPGWHLVILGEGPQRPALEEIARLSAAPMRIHLPGIAGNLGEWYVRADLYVMTAQPNGFPNGLAEALSHGLPAVSFDSDTGTRDVIRHGVDGLMVAPGDVAQLSESLERLMRDDELRRCFAVRARDACDRFSFARVAALWEDLFGEVAAARGHRREDAGLAGRARGKG
ncbi:MAG: glycosyltransferase [Pseudomonadota bacterium]